MHHRPSLTQCLLYFLCSRKAFEQVLLLATHATVKELNNSRTYLHMSRLCTPSPLPATQGQRQALHLATPYPIVCNHRLKLWLTIKQHKGASMIVTTTPAIEGHPIVDYLGIVTGEAILGANLFKDLFADIRDIVGGRSATYERELQRARDVALQEIVERAAALGANAIVGLDLDYEVLGTSNGMLMVSASGTAVVIS